MVEERRKRAPNRRLDSWKEIAAFFGKDERTVKRWEKERGLPVLRLPGARGGVYAFSDDLSRWMEAPKLANSSSANGNQGDRDVAFAASGSVGTQQGSVAVLELVVASEATLARAGSESMRPVPKAWLPPSSVAFLLVAIAAIAGLLYQKRMTVSRNPLKVAAVAKSVTHHQPSPQALDLYLKGRYYWNKRTPAALNQARDYFMQAIATDPDYAQAYVGLADCFNLLREYSVMPEDEAYAKATSAARKAVELDDSLADAHNSLAFDLFYGSLDATGAEREFRRALSLDPNCELAHHWYATYLMTLGRNQEALQQIEIAQQLNSSSTSILADKGLILYSAGRTDEAMVLLKQISQTDPSFLSTHRYLALIGLTTGKYDEYLAEARKAALLSKSDTELSIVDAAAKGLQSGGPRGMLEAMFSQEKTLYAKSAISAYRLAETASLLGEKQEAMDYLRTAHARHDSSLSKLLVDPELRTLRNDPSYRELISQLGLPQLTTS